MALINCVECNKQISSKAKLCPSCGSPIDKKSSWIRIFFIVAGVLLFVYIISASQSVDTKQSLDTNQSADTKQSSYSNHLNVPSDPKADYSVVYEAMNGANPVLITKRHTDESGTSYTKTEFDCSNSKYRPIADSEDFESIQNNQSSLDFVDLVHGSIKYWQWDYACRK